MHRPVTLQLTRQAISFNHKIMLGAGINPGIRFYY